MGIAKFRIVVAPVAGPKCLGITFGWDTPTRWFKPYISFEAFNWMACTGWMQSFRSAEAPEYERQASAVVMRRDYWTMARKPQELIRAGVVHRCDTDSPELWILQNLLQTAMIKDGDEFELMVTATDRRPHGDRLYVRDRRGNYRPETDDECLERIELNGN